MVNGELADVNTPNSIIYEALVYMGG